MCVRTYRTCDTKFVRTDSTCIGIHKAGVPTTTTTRRDEEHDGISLRFVIKSALHCVALCCFALLYIALQQVPIRLMRGWKT